MGKRSIVIVLAILVGVFGAAVAAAVAATTVTHGKAHESVVAQPAPNRPSTVPGVTTAPARATSSVPAPPTTTAVQCPSLSIGNDGTIAPLFCSNGNDNPAALAYYGGNNRRGFDPGVLRLAVAATQQQVVTAICSDLSPGSPMGIQTEQQAVQLAANRAGWTFDLNVVNINCSGRTTTTK